MTSCRMRCNSSLCSNSSGKGFRSGSSLSISSPRNCTGSSRRNIFTRFFRMKSMHWFAAILNSQLRNA